MRTPFGSALRARLVALAAVVGAASFAFAGACSGKKNTEIIIGVQSDVRVPKDIDEVQVRVLVDGVVVFDPRTPVGPSGASLPGSFGVVAGSDRPAPIVVEVLGWSNGNPRVLRRARLTFVQGRTLLLRMPLNFACYDKLDCPEDQTCVAGSCVDAFVESASLSDYVSATQIFGNGAGSGVDACFSAEECLPSTSQVASAGTACAFYAPHGGGDGTSAPIAFTPVVVLPSSATTLGYCVGTYCWIPLDHDAQEGWEWTDETKTTFVVAPGLCTKMTELGGHLGVTTACGEKTPERPVCTPLSGGSGTDAGEVGLDSDGGLSCTSPWVPCADTCVLLASDPKNCGSCGHACAAFELCASSSCASAYAGTWSGSFSGTVTGLGTPVSGSATLVLQQGSSRLTGTGTLNVAAFPACGATTVPCTGTAGTGGATLVCTNAAGKLDLTLSLPSASAMAGTYAWQATASGCFPSTGTFSFGKGVDGPGVN